MRCQKIGQVVLVQCNEFVTFFPVTGLGNYCLRLFFGWGVMVHCLEIYIYPGAVLPLVQLNFYLSRSNPGALDAALGEPHHYDDITFKLRNRQRPTQGLTISI